MAAIHFDGWGNLYVTLGQPDEANRPLDAGEATGQAGSGWSLHLQYHPMIALIWIGVAIMALGGLIAASDRLFATRGRKVEAVAATPAPEVAS